VADTTEEIFLSYHHNDRELAGKIKRSLELKGFTVFLAHEDIDPSVEWRDAIQEHLSSCTAVIAIVTRDFEKSSFTNQEVGIAMANDKKVIPLVFDIRLKDLPGFLEAKQAVPGSRHRLSRSLDRAIRPFARQPRPKPELLDRMTLGLSLFSIMCLIALSSAVLWVFLGAQVFPWGPFVGIILGGAIVFDRYYTGSLDIMKAIDWCKRNTPLILVGAGCFVPASLAFSYSLSLYPAFSRLRFDTYLDSAPSVAFETFMVLIFGAFMLYHPTTSLRGMRHEVLTWIRRHYKSWKVYTYAAILIVLTLSTSLVDTTFVLGTPRVSLVESKDILDTVVHVYGFSTLQLRAWTTNQRVVHLTLPSVLLISQVTYDVQSNSTKQPTITESEGLTVVPEYNSLREMTGVAITIKRLALAATVSITYFNDFNISAFAFVPLETLTTTQTFENGTDQLLQKFKIDNESHYWLSLDSIPVYLGGAGSAPTNVTLSLAPSPWPSNPYGFWPPSWTYAEHMMYLNGYIAPHGSLAIVVIYNRF
jgi:hypothetical protein